MEWLHLYNTRGPEAISAPAPPLLGDRERPRRDNPCRPTIRRSAAGSWRRSATALDPAASGRLGARAVDLLPRDDPRRSASPGGVLEEAAARPGRSAAPH